MKKKGRKTKFIVPLVPLCFLLIFSIYFAIYSISNEKNPTPIPATETWEIEEPLDTPPVSNTMSESVDPPEDEEPENMTQVSEIDIHDYFTASEITDEIFARIDGCSYVENDDISIDDLRYLQVLHTGFDGETHVGELIVNKAIAEDILEIMYELYLNEYPIEQMTLVDEFGADDELSMQADNTSAFNYRTVDGSSSLSMHSYGLAIDINPFYNPCVRTYSDGSVKISPEGSDDYSDRSKDFAHKIGETDLCYQLFMEHGFSWGGDWNSLKDYQHFYFNLD